MGRALHPGNIPRFEYVDDSTQATIPVKAMIFGGARVDNKAIMYTRSFVAESAFTKEIRINQDWLSTHTFYNDGNVTRTFEHELLHVLGLDHSDDTSFSVMSGTRNLSSRRLAIITVDDIDTIDTIYNPNINLVANNCINTAPTAGAESTPESSNTNSTEPLVPSDYLKYLPPPPDPRPAGCDIFSYDGYGLPYCPNH